MSPELALQLLVYGLANGSVIALNALGFTLVYGTVRVLNLAHGEVFALSTVLAGVLLAALGLGPSSPPIDRFLGLALTLVAAIGFGAGLNVAVERLAFRPFRGRSPLGPLVATLAISLMLYQAALWWRALAPPSRGTAPNPHHGAPNVPLARVPDLVPPLDLVGLAGIDVAVQLTLKDALVVLLAVGLALALGTFLARTRPGRAVRATAIDAELAELCGVNTGHAMTLAFALGGGVAGAAGLVYVLYTNGLFTQHGALSGLVAFTAAVLGGIGQPRGALAAGFGLGVFSAFSDFLLDAHWTPVLVLAMLVLALAVRPSGLFGEERPGDPTDYGLVNRQEADVGPRSERRLRATNWVPLGLVGLAALYPWIDGLLGLRLQLNAMLVLLLVVLALGLNIVVGQAGLLDLGYAAFFAIGAYTAALLTASGSRLAVGLPGILGDFVIVLVLSALVAALAGVLLGTSALRMRPEYLAITTLAFGEIVPGLIRHLDAWTGGARGMAGVPRPRLLGLELDGPTAWYELALALAVVAALVSARLRSARQGRAWAAVSQDELAAASVGVSPPRAKLLAFALGAALAGMAGAIFASTLGYVEPGQFDFLLSMMVLSMVMLGGFGGLGGTVIGVLLIAGYDRFAIGQLDAWLRHLGAITGLEPLRTVDLRQANFFVFGLALYLTARLRVARLPTFVQRQRSVLL
jgi:branched-chain amino acid transport system permease protein